jgi:formylglycine-generating enzyme required for sulfatase activity
MNRILALAVLLFAFPAQAEVNIEWVTVGDAGNAADTTGYGAVSYEYQIGKYEVTNAQYAEFLNAVAAADPGRLYGAGMDSGTGGITRSGSSGSYSYSTISGRENMPVVRVSFWDVIRFANWLHNGQPTGAQDDTTTEDGAYVVMDSTVGRNAGAAVFLASEDEWYKAAYYKGGGTSAGYWAYPIGSDTPPTCEEPPTVTLNSANCDGPPWDLSDVGSYSGSASPAGTFDQGGNVWELNEGMLNASTRSARGGYFGGGAGFLAASFRNGWPVNGEVSTSGFRVARLVPAPPVPSLSPFALATLCTLLGLAGLRRLRG